ncbi:transcriptional regulator FtrA [Falsiroseomonas oryzae]|uniref:transcriptional regulator FtrA n=1 Tax=Falsiroseomonas oryzae TaxID=2766473 RepID=UPI0022EA361E|nr:transcriptional regulator FtrA [Roseomonas sp. MO-31]
MPDRARPGPPANRLVVVVAYDGLCTFEFGCAVEVFGLPRPEMGEGWYRFAVAAAEPGPLRAAGGVRVLVDGGLDLVEQAGTVVVPGWRGTTEPVPEALCAALRAAAARGARILSLCSGAFVLAAAGLLDGRRATTHWRHFEALAARHPGLTLVHDVLYVDEGQVLTAAGSAAGLDLCLHLIRRDFGPDAANSVAERLVVPPHRDGSRVQRVTRPVPRERSSGSRLAATLDRVRESLAEDWPVARLAAEAATSTRGLHRRFREAVGMPPGAWLLEERVARARDLLETTALPVEEVALAVGFRSVPALRLHLRRRTGLAPSAYRGWFRRESAAASPPA